MTDVGIGADRIQIGPRFAVSFHRTLRIPDDGRVYPLPPGLGTFPIRRVADFGERVPAAWRDTGGAFIAMHQREALWLGFHGASWKPNAVKVAIGGINALTGEPDGPELGRDPQNYLVAPAQPWLDGIKTGTGSVRQFVAMPLGQGYTVEAALTGDERRGGLQITVFEPRPGRFPDAPPPAPSPSSGPMRSLAAGMGIGAGGVMRQKVYPDPHGVETWDEASRVTVSVHIANSLRYREITGEDPPPTPIDAATYTEHGLPWFALYDEERGDIAPSERLAGASTIAARDAERDAEDAGRTSVDIPEPQVRKIPGGPAEGRPGSSPPRPR